MPGQNHISPVDDFFHAFKHLKDVYIPAHGSEGQVTVFIGFQVLIRKDRITCNYINPSLGLYSHGLVSRAVTGGGEHGNKIVVLIFSIHCFKRHILKRGLDIQVLRLIGFIVQDMGVQGKVQFPLVNPECCILE